MPTAWQARTIQSASEPPLVIYAHTENACGVVL
jgi:hypothetical protein